MCKCARWVIKMCKMSKCAKWVIKMCKGVIKMWKNE